MRFNKILTLSPLLFLCVVPNPSFGMGGAKPPDGTSPPGASCPNPSPPISVANPTRQVLLSDVGTRIFQLPNGGQADIGADLSAILETAAGESQIFQPVSGGEVNGPCNQYLKLKSAVSAIELDLYEIGIRFGYKGSVPTDTLSNLTGTAKVKFGNVSMEFSVWNCINDRCTQIAATTATNVTANINVTAEIDFNSIKTGPEFVSNPSIKAALRAIMNDGLKRLANSPKLPELPWFATVREVNELTGEVIFNAGRTQNILPHQNFEVWAVTPSTGVCEVYKTVAYVKTQRVDSISSSAIIEQQHDVRGIKEGDIVKVRLAK